ncbi:MAG: carboxypeptidase regulatory-like domain-containing protein [Candidatus Neomarinimicrobiota bacterium]
MQIRRSLLLSVILLIPIITTAAFLAVGFATSSDPATGSVSGVVVDDDGPIAAARVRMRATDHLTFSGLDGRFSLSELPEGSEIEITAWADGYYIASTHVTPTVGGITLTLRPYHTVDHPDYQWISPISGTAPRSCEDCHLAIMSQWATNAHGRAVSNPRFFSLYNGTDLTGTSQIDPGYLNDFPGTAGNCANCHAPGAGVDGYLTTNMNAVRDVITAGLHCDYCHKIGGAYLNPATGSVYPNAPGVQSQRILRPPAGDNIFFGPYDDAPDPDSYLPLMTQSQYCASCHQFRMWGTPIYESYEEWLTSPYAAMGIHCQDCHMAPDGVTTNIAPGTGGFERDPMTIATHLQPGAANVELLQKTVSMTLFARQVVDRIEVAVTIANTGAGHHVPTDFPGRHLILEIDAGDETGRSLAQLSGPVVPEWGGPQAGQPGQAYAKLLMDLASGDYPVVSYWKQALIVADNRIPALAADRSTYGFLLPAGADEIQLTARLLFRRLFQNAADEKGWDKPDIIMVEEELTIPLETWHKAYLPLLMGSGS